MNLKQYDTRWLLKEQTSGSNASPRPHGARGPRGSLKRRDCRVNNGWIVSRLFSATCTYCAYQDDQIPEGPHLPEAELQDIYKDLLSFPEVDRRGIQESSNTDLKNHQVPELIQTLEERLSAFETAVDANTAQTGLSSRLLARMGSALSSTKHEVSNLSSSQHKWLLEDGSSLRKMLNRLRSVIDKMDATWRTDVGEPSSERNHIPLGMLSNTEWASFLQACVSKRSTV